MQQLGFAPGVVYMDKEFCEGPIVRYLTQARIPAILACTIRGTTGGTRALCRGRKGYCTDYTFTDGTVARLALRPARVPDETGHRHLKWLAFVVIHLDWSAKKVAQRYRRRFGIESSYRQFGRLRARTASRNPALRFVLLGLALLLLNIWVMLRWAATRLIVSGGPTLPAQVPNAPLGSWTDLPGQEVKNFSGTARYAIDFPRPATPSGTRCSPSGTSPVVR